MQKKTISILIVVVLLIAGTIFFFNNGQTAPEKSITNLNMQISSPAFQHNGRIPALYTCDGKNISPPLAISDVPETAQSLVLISDDPDAPVGTWVHWLVWNIDPKTTEIAEHTAPAGAIEGTTSFGNVGYGGPCPPSGTHRYFFKLYALDIRLDLPKSTDKKALEEAMKDHILAKAEIIGLYSRPGA